MSASDLDEGPEYEPRHLAAVAAELIRERGFWQLLRAASKTLPPRRGWAIAIGVVVAFVGLGTALLGQDVAVIASGVRAIAGLLFATAAGLLSFVLAGFAVFMTVGTSEIAIHLALQKVPGDNPPELKRMALHFVHFFAACFFTMLVALPVLTVGFAGGPVTVVTVWLFSKGCGAVATYACAAVLGVLCGFSLFLVLAIKDFVFNMFSMFMLLVAARVVRVEATERKKKLAHDLAQLVDRDRTGGAGRNDGETR